MELQINGQRVNAPQALADDPLLWVLREDLGLVGTKFGCGQGVCGACTVHVAGKAQRSCLTACGSVQGQAITTIEGLAGSDALHPVQQAWSELQVAQCGYCQAGQMMSAAALLAGNSMPSDEQIQEAMNGNLCRCGTYPRIKAAVQRAAQIMRNRKGGAV